MTNQASKGGTAMESLTRRKVIVSGLAGTAAAAVVVLPTLAASTGSDAKLMQLCRHWHRIERALDRVLNHLSDAQEAHWEMPIIPKPAILLTGFEVWPGSEACACRPDLKSLHDYDGHRSDKVPYLHRSDLEPVAKGSFLIEARLLPGGAPGDESVVPIPQEARDKAKACLMALDQWEAAEEAQAAEVSLWEAKTDRIHDL
jgi:hypothetical protein